MVITGLTRNQIFRYAAATKLNMERYRSGHNGADSKSVCEQSHMGSNPILSANGNRINPVFMRFFHTYIAKRAGIEIPALLLFLRGVIKNFMITPLRFRDLCRTSKVRPRAELL